MGRALDEALQAGDELLRCLAGPAEAVEMDRVEALVAQRAAALSQVEAGPSAEDLERLMVQQRQLERQFSVRLEGMRQVNVGAQAVRQHVQGVNRLLDPGPRSRLLNTTR